MLRRFRLPRLLRGAEVEKGSYLRVEGGVISLNLPAPNLHIEVVVAPAGTEAIQVEPAVEYPSSFVLPTSDGYSRAIQTLFYRANFGLQEFDVGERGQPFVRIAVEIATPHRLVAIWMGLKRKRAPRIRNQEPVP